MVLLSINSDECQALPNAIMLMKLNIQIAIPANAKQEHFHDYSNLMFTEVTHYITIT